MALPVFRPTEPVPAYLLRLVAALEQRARLARQESQAEQDDTLRALFPVGALYCTESTAVPDALVRIGTWTDSTTAGTKGTSISAYIFERLT